MRHRARPCVRAMSSHQPLLLDARPPADYQRDIHDPNTKRAEALVLRWARRLKHWDVRDVRWRNRHGDFVLTHRTKDLTYLLDAKADRYMDTTGNVAFEWEIEHPDGTFTPGWGQDMEPCLIASVGTQQWATCVIVDLNDLREFTLNAANVLSGRAKKFRTPDGDRFAHGWAVPIFDLKRAGVLVMTVNLKASPKNSGNLCDAGR